MEPTFYHVDDFVHHGIPDSAIVKPSTLVLVEANDLSCLSDILTSNNGPVGSGAQAW
jgi:hypothetical protein